MPARIASCLLCDTECSPPTFEGDGTNYNCGICGSYRITGSALPLFQESNPPRWKLASWVYEQNSAGIKPSLTRDFVQNASDIAVPTLEKRARAYLEAFYRSSDGALQHQMTPRWTGFMVPSWCRTEQDADAFAEYWVNRGAITRTASLDIRLGVAGRILYEDTLKERASTHQVFVAMSFQADLNPIYEQGIFAAILGSGYSALRVDRKEHEGKIDDLIIAEIRRSAFTVADLTNHRGGVYYEAGFAHGLGQRVIFTCRADSLTEAHFDIRQYNTIKWESAEDLKRSLQNRILAVFGAGPDKPDAQPLPQYERLVHGAATLR
jgi:hypothetical protein